jgi:hypothetical protein
MPGLSGRELSPIAHVDREVRPSHFRLVESRAEGPRAPAGVSRPCRRDSVERRAPWPDDRIVPPAGGANGLTAYAGLFHVAGLQDGDVVWVSAAAGGVGSLVAEMAKIRGHRVIGSAGSDEKVRYLLDDLGLDAAFNYRSGPVRELLDQAAPEGIDVYFDNVGGNHLEAALGALHKSGSVAICGMVSQYSVEEGTPGPDNLFLGVAKILTIRGFRGSSYVGLLPEMRGRAGACSATAAFAIARRYSTV